MFPGRSPTKALHGNLSRSLSPASPSYSELFSPHRRGLHRSGGSMLFSAPPYDQRHGRSYGRRREHLLLRLDTYSNFSLPSSVASKPLHALTITTGATVPTAFYNNLISRYALSGELTVARTVFDEMPGRNDVSFNSMITAYSRAGHMGESFHLLSQMMFSGLRPTEFTFGGILSSLSGLHHALHLHPLILKTGLLHGEPFSGTTLLGVYGRHGRLDDARKIFQQMHTKSVATWNSMLTEFSRRKLSKDAMLLFKELLRTDIGWSEYSFLGVLSAINPSDGSEFGEQLHGLAISSGFDSYVAIANAIVNMYSSCVGICPAERMFISMSGRDLVSWNTMIAASSKSDRPVHALQLFSMMSFLDGFLPNESTLAIVVNTCTHLMMPEFGEFVHVKAIKLGLDMDDFVVSSLVDFYGKCKSLEDACSLFSEITEKNVASWNALLGSYSFKGSRYCIVLFQEMLRLGFRPNEFSFSSVLKWSSISELLQLHSLIVKMGYDSNEYVCCAITASYAAKDEAYEALRFVNSLVSPLSVAFANVLGGIHNKNGHYQETKRLISHLQGPDIVSGNIFITACARSGDYEEAFQFFKSMHAARGSPDSYAAVGLLSICTKLNSLVLGSLIHGLMIKASFDSFDVFAHNVLLDMYAKCGSFEGAFRIFEEMDERNLISWTALISALGLHGFAHDSLKTFKQMESEGFWPDHVSFVAVLSACRHGGLLDEGLSLFNRMKSEYGVEPEMDHYVCVVDLLCRCGQLNEAEHVISSMPFQPNAEMWRIFLKTCRNFASTEM
uniref:Pentatricopeptide repeat-containing protein At3g58590 n=1 Tax=Anthurium amnicola TaxID=1678845 RepID=A0A1D1Z5K7_9ARAE